MEILTKLEKKILNLFSSLSDKDVFYLTGGTALSAFFLKHRKSYEDPGFDLYWLGVAMERINNFPDNSPDLHLLIRPCTMPELKYFFNNWRKEIAKEITGRGRE